MNEHDEKLRILALAIRKGIDVRGPEAVSILEDAADYIEFLFEELQMAQSLHPKQENESFGLHRVQCCVVYSPDTPTNSSLEVLAQKGW